MKKLLAAAGVVVALGAGVFALSTVLPAGAQTHSTVTAADPLGPGGPGGPGHADKLKSVLDGLVANDAITQDQEAKILAAVQAAAPRGPKGHFGMGKGILNKGIDTAAGALGMSADDLKAELKAGKTIADVATEKGVPLDAVTKALTDAANAAIDQAVTDGKLTQAQADGAKGKVAGAVDHFEHANPPKGPGRHGPRPGFAPPGDDSGSTSSSSSS